VQEEVSRQIADMLRLNITNEQRQRIAKKYTDNPEAYQLYLKGRHYQLKDTPDDLRKSRQYYEQAIDADPSYALAYTGLSEYYGLWRTQVRYLLKKLGQKWKQQLCVPRSWIPTWAQRTASLR